MKRFLPFLVLVLIVVFSDSMNAQTSYGIRIGQYDDVDELFIGGEIIAPVNYSFSLNPNLEYVFVEKATFATLNCDLLYYLNRRSNLPFWFGGGLGLAYVNPEGKPESDTDLGINILGGVAFNTRTSITPYIQAKLLLGDYDDFVLAFGLRF